MPAPAGAAAAPRSIARPGAEAVALALDWDSEQDALEWAEAVASYVNEAFDAATPWTAGARDLRRHRVLADRDSGDRLRTVGLRVRRSSSPPIRPTQPRSPERSSASPNSPSRNVVEGQALHLARPSFEGLKLDFR